MATFVCPACWKVTEMPDDMAGRRARCPDCHATGPVQPKGSAAAPAEARREASPVAAAPLAPPPQPHREEAPRESPPRSPRFAPRDVWRVVTDVAWALCLLWTLGVLIEFTASLNLKAPSDEQTLRAVRAVVLVAGGYVIARAVHGIAGRRQRD